MAELQDKDLKRSIEELKMELFDLEESRKSLAETSSWQQEQLESKIRQ